MFTSIVAGTDGSSTATAAVQRAAELARLTGARLHVVSAYRTPETVAAMAVAGAAAGGVAADVAVLSRELHDEAEEILDRTLVRQVVGDASVDRHVRPGNPAEVLVSVADEVNADLIVVGNRGMRGARRFLLGSVPNRVAHSSGCTVMIVHTC